MIRPGVLLLLSAVGPLAAQSTRAERTAFRETSSYADVLGFLDSLSRATGEIRIGTLAISPEGRRVPYVLAGRPLPSGAKAAQRSGKLIVYLQANIHAGEVEGKEATQMLLRDLTVGSLGRLLDSLVLLVVPIYNTDGNERLDVGERSRPGQNGPSIVGQNTNGQGLNLNRDYMKLEAPETRGAVHLIEAWDPDLLVDMHTTNGSYHGYVLTYAPSLNPNSNPATGYVRDRLLPEVRQRMQRRYGQQTFSYGNFRNQEPDSLALGWETFDARPRFSTNWMGLRGRLAVLSEGYSNADFRTRVQATYNFVRELLSVAAERSAAIKAVVAAADRMERDSIALRSALGPATLQDVIAEITKPAGEGAGGFSRRQRTGVYRTIRMPVYDRFVATRREALPAAYLIPPRLQDVVDLLRRQGVLVDRMTASLRLPAQTFALDTLIADQLFEGHRTVSAEGRWAPSRRDTTLSAGWFIVPTSQSLGILAAYLLEPVSDDGVVTWNLLDRELQPRAGYPILRLTHPLRVPAVAVP